MVSWDIELLDLKGYPTMLTRPQVWSLYEDKHLFYGREPTDWNPNGNGYTTRAHLAEFIAALGPPPADFLQRGKRSVEFFTEDGMTPMTHSNNDRL